MKRTRLWLACLVLVVTTLIVGYAYSRIWKPHQKMSDTQWLATASPQEQRKTAHQILRLPVGNHHDAFLVLILHGTEESVPYLLNRLKKYADGDFIECSHDHCVAALRRITGLDAGYRYADWKRTLEQR